MKKIIQYLPVLLKSKDMLVYLAISIVLLLLAIVLFGRLGLAYQSAQETKQEVSNMINFVTEFDSSAAKINSEPYRPIMAEQLDNVQSNIFMLVLGNQLNINSFRTGQNDQKNLYSSAFELEIEGNWEQAVRVLENFHVRDALIAINAVKITPTKMGGVKMLIDYKLNTKNPARPSQGQGGK